MVHMNVFLQSLKGDLLDDVHGGGDEGLVHCEDLKEPARGIQEEDAVYNHREVFLRKEVKLKTEEKR